MIEIKIPSKRKCLASIDMVRTKAILSFERRGELVEVEFTEKQWITFRQLVTQFPWKPKIHRGFCEKIKGE